MFKLFAKSHETHITDLLPAYLDGQVGAVEERQIEAHLNLCADCRAEWESLQATQRLLRALPAPVLPRAFVLSRQAVPVQAAGPLTGWYGRLRTATALAVVTLLLLVAGDIGQTLAPLRLGGHGEPGRGAAPAPTIYQEQSPESLRAMGPPPTLSPSVVLPPTRPAPAPATSPPAPMPTSDKSATALSTPTLAPTLVAGGASPTPQPPVVEQAGVTATPVPAPLADRDSQVKSDTPTPVGATGEIRHPATTAGPLATLPPIRWLEGLVLTIVLALTGVTLWVRRRTHWL